MIANFHSHTPRCRHAFGAEESYVQNAIARGLTTFGFSDHTPQFFPGDYYSFMRMRPEELDGYCQTVRSLQQRYRNKLHIPLGLEAEYYPAIWGELLPRLRDAGIEYLLLGQHWIGNEENEHGSGRATTDEALLKRYCYQVMEGLETGVFTYLCHPDLFHYVGEHKIYRRYMGELCRFAKQAGIPLELNLLGIYECKHYPYNRFWELAAEEGCQVILGMDAHDPEYILDLKPEQAARNLAQNLGLNLIHTVELRPIY